VEHFHWCRGPDDDPEPALEEEEVEQGTVFPKDDDEDDTPEVFEPVEQVPDARELQVPPDVLLAVLVGPTARGTFSKLYTACDCSNDRSFRSSATMESLAVNTSRSCGITKT
jgi:hypothetical protein